MHNSYIRLIAEAIEPLYGQREAENIARGMGEYIVEWPPEKVDTAILRLCQNEPWQYVVGYAWFYGLELAVSPATLIPRPETEELVYNILQQQPRHGRMEILDIGTGSGCIPLAVKANRPEWQVSSCDVSADALDVARSNAAKNQLEVVFFEQDIFRNFPDPDREWDIIVSNPPYIPHREAELMRDNVLKYEPHLALFVPDATPLLFYRRIAEIGLSHLKAEGYLYFELNEYYADDTRAMIQKLGYQKVSVQNDLSGKSRFLVAQRPV